MTKNQKKLWDLLPPGEWVERDKIHEQFGKFNFQLALSYLHTIKFIELKFEPIPDRPHLTRQFMRRKTTDEIQKMR